MRARIGWVSCGGSGAASGDNGQLHRQNKRNNDGQLNEVRRIRNRTNWSSTVLELLNSWPTLVAITIPVFGWIVNEFFKRSDQRRHYKRERALPQ